MPFFSVIIPTYNRADLITNSINSVLNQKFKDLELIIVDDGSTDSTREVIQQIDDPRIHYVFQVNAERGAARNKGVSLAKGKYVFFLDSDDLLYEEHLQHAYSEINALDSPAFFHVRYELKSESGIIKSTPLLNTRTILRKTLKQNQFACQFFLKRDIALQFPFSENKKLKIGEDWEVVLKIAVRHPLYFSNRKLAAIVQHGGRTMQLASADSILTSRDILISNLSEDRLISGPIKSNVWAELTHLAALSYAIECQKKLARKCLSDSIKSNFGLIFTRRTLAIFKKLIFTN